jgi:hypothetical protein
MHFTRFSIFTLDLEETDLRTGPRISQIGPQDANLDCNWVPGTMTGGGSSIAARGRLGSAGKGRGSAQGLTCDRSGVRRLRGHAGEGARRHHDPAAAATGLPTNRTLGLEHKRPGDL